MLESLKVWILAVFQGFKGLKPIEQFPILLAVPSVLIAIIKSPWLLRRHFHNRRQRNLSDLGQETLSLPTAKISLNIPLSELPQEPRPLWEYQWEVGEGVTPCSVDPPLERAISAELIHSAKNKATNTLIFVKGELGIGKTTLLKVLVDELKHAAELISNDNRAASNYLLTCSLLEAGDLEPAQDFAKRIGDALSHNGAVVVFGRPLTLSAVQRHLGIVPRIAVTLMPFSPGKQLFHHCLKEISLKLGLTDPKLQEQLRSIVSNFNEPILQTPFYFEQTARALLINKDLGISSNTPFEIFYRSLEQRVTRFGGKISDFVACAIGEKDVDSIPKLAGVIGDTGFVHDGYRNVLLASALIIEGRSFKSILMSANVLPAVDIILSHMRAIRQLQNVASSAAFEVALRDFVYEESPLSQQFYPVFFQAKVARAFLERGDTQPAEALRDRCLNIIGSISNNVTAEDISGLLWDVSDALTLIGDPRLKNAARNNFSSVSGFFTFIPESEITIGSDFIPMRTDLAKPVTPYKRCEVVVGPMWIANYLVTTEQFLEFWHDPDRANFFSATGKRWLAAEPELINQIRQMFDVSAKRCFWKEISDKVAVTTENDIKRLPSPIELARLRATDPTNRLNSTGADSLWSVDRFCEQGKPVVGVNWWEAMAYCRWWTAKKLPAAGFQKGGFASLPTDWEWEAIRRTFYSLPEDIDASESRINTFVAHTRVRDAKIENSRKGSVLHPLHVGLCMPVKRPGPTDMVGNVWEWTRSRVFGEIAMAEVLSDDFGPTKWNDGDLALEQDPMAPMRDIVEDDNDLSYRAVRGGSFFSRDSQAAWHPAYRLCDPPFSSYLDLGFRIAIYLPSETQDFL